MVRPHNRNDGMAPPRSVRPCARPGEADTGEEPEHRQPREEHGKLAQPRELAEGGLPGQGRVTVRDGVHSAIARSQPGNVPTGTPRPPMIDKPSMIAVLASAVA